MGELKRFPCRGCEDRSVGCHGTCEKYREEKARLEQVKQAKEYERSYMGYKYSRDMVIYKKLRHK